jgi:hypothetical protein
MTPTGYRSLRVQLLFGTDILRARGPVSAHRYDGHDLTFADGLYVAIAEHLGGHLLTDD